MLDIRYTKLKFNIQFLKNSKLPMHKGSALRGGMGTVLLKNNCIEDGNCNSCEFNEGCVVTNIINPKIKNDLSFVRKNSTTSPFIIDCPDKRTFYSNEDVLSFNVTLLGKVIAYLPQFIYSFDLLGEFGLSLKKNKFKLLSVLNEDNQLIYEKGRFFKENISIKTLKDYVEKRKESIEGINTIRFITPFRFSKKGKITNTLNFKDILFSVYRRLLILNSYEGNDVEENIPDIEGSVRQLGNYWVDIKRYSNRQNSYMKLGGIIGEIEISKEINLIKDYVIACEITHIGKNTSFGLGKFVIN